MSKKKSYMNNENILAEGFFSKLGKRSLTNRDYEEFFKNMGTEELMKLGLDPDEIRIKLDQIMEWNDPKNKPYLESGVKK